MSIPLPSNDYILEFWRWFEGIADKLGSNFDNPTLLEELDRQVARLGGVAWELGPGSSAENSLAISPDGAADLLPLTQQIVSLAPEIPHWEFLPARPARPQNLEFSIGTTTGSEIDIDARQWRYVLFRFPDGTFDLVLEQGNMGSASDEERFTAAVVLLDGLLGEARRLRSIGCIETVAALESGPKEKASPVASLVAHLDSFKSNTPQVDRT
jgi:hypothetical protein